MILTSTFEVGQIFQVMRMPSASSSCEKSIVLAKVILLMLFKRPAEA